MLSKANDSNSYRLFGSLPRNGQVMWGKVYWPIALTFAALVMFGIPELIALFTNPANTLSDYSWSELNVTVAYGHGIHTVAWWASIVVWFVFIVVITIHIWWRGA